MGNGAFKEFKVQLTVYEESKKEDLEELSQRFDSIRVELDSVEDCFQLVCNSVTETPAMPYFLSIMQHLLCIREDVKVK